MNNTRLVFGAVMVSEFSSGVDNWGLLIDGTTPSNATGGANYGPGYNH